MRDFAEQSIISKFNRFNNNLVNKLSPCQFFRKHNIIFPSFSHTFQKYEK